MGDVERSLSGLSLGLEEDVELTLQEENEDKSNLPLNDSFDAGDLRTMSRLQTKVVNQIFSGNSTSCGLGPVMGLDALGKVDMNSAEAMDTREAENVPLEHTESLKRQRLHPTSSNVSSNPVDSNEDFPTLKAGLADQARHHQ
ncbi:hypothetical protein V6N13_118224 [Hibiscus sabdariffa]|uniref:Uncharacterized protein n=1 Tax=Hibiscus sabdariffa TaxID=183260 RepID=A0ABR2Q8D8_9ROSI